MKNAMTVTVMTAVLMLAVGNADAAGARKPGKQVTGVVNLNQASAQQLDLLPGVGPKAAQRIIEQRKKTPFTRPEELVQVKGFGKKKFDKLKMHLAVAGPTTLRQLVASDKVLEQGRAAPAPR